MSFEKGSILGSWLGSTSVSPLAREVLEDTKHRQSLWFYCFFVVGFDQF